MSVPGVNRDMNREMRLLGLTAFITLDVRTPTTLFPGKAFACTATAVALPRSAEVVPRFTLLATVQPSCGCVENPAAMAVAVAGPVTGGAGPVAGGAGVVDGGAVRVVGGADPAAGGAGSVDGGAGSVAGGTGPAAGDAVPVTGGTGPDAGGSGPVDGA